MTIKDLIQVIHGDCLDILLLGVNPKAERQTEDFYATEPKALEIFIDIQYMQMGLLCITLIDQQYNL